MKVNTTNPNNIWVHLEWQWTPLFGGISIASVSLTPEIAAEGLDIDAVNIHTLWIDPALGTWLAYKDEVMDLSNVDNHVATNESCVNGLTPEGVRCELAFSITVITPESCNTTPVVRTGINIEPFECSINASCDPQVTKPFHKVISSVVCTTGQTITSVSWKLFDEDYNLITQGTGNPVSLGGLQDEPNDIQYILEAHVTASGGHSGYFYGNCMYSEGA